jgi:hypothetical protein
MSLTLRFARRGLAGRGAAQQRAKSVLRNCAWRSSWCKETLPPVISKDTYRADLKRRVQEMIHKKETHSLDVEDPKDEGRPKAQAID